MKTLFTCLLLAAGPLSAQDYTGWYAFQPGELQPANAIDRSQWLDAPAGKHGFLTFRDADFVFEDGTPVKFWGVNICGDKPFSTPAVASQWTNFMRSYGINGVRFHKFTWDATDGIHSTQITPANWSNYDFFCKELREAGIYYSWSAIYGHRVMPADSARLLAYKEVKETRFPWSHLNGTTCSIVNFAEDLQAVNIELYVNMLNHRNPHTGLRYADDPALSFIELQNEDNIFWGAIEQTLKQTPTYRALLCKKFSDWLIKKYGDEAALRKAWGGQGIVPGESLDQKNIYPNPNHGFFSHEYEQATKENRAVPVHVADRATFLYEEQLAFYQRFVKAIRETGYRGVIVGSCWQAGSGISHFYNLHADYITGPIDRHNYFGGGRGHRFQPGPFNPAAMVTTPGSGLLSTGFQMVADRPFQISEWMSLIPTPWTAESSPLIAAYGMGLQGWDASYAFAMDHPHFTPTIQSGHGIYNVTSPTQLGLYPALTTMIYRNDVTTARVIANRNVNVADLRKGELGFLEKTAQSYDVKSFASSVPAEALAIGAVTVSFNQPGEIDLGNLERYWNKAKKTITSVTGELHWDYHAKGFVTINTPGTKGLIGFASGVTHQLGDVRMTCDNDFAVVLVNNIEKDRRLNNAKRILVTTIARAANTGMTLNEAGDELLTIGSAPVLLEPVRVQLSIKRKGTPTVYALDHAGNRTGVTIPLQQGKIILDGERYQTLYYEIVYP